MSLADDLKPFAIEALTQATGAALHEFFAREPDAATAAEAAAKVIDQVLARMPVAELRKYLTDEARERAELAFSVAQAAGQKR